MTKLNRWIVKASVFLFSSSLASSQGTWGQAPVTSATTPELYFWTDHSKQLFSLGELAPSIGGSHQVTVAYKENGRLLTTDGFARLVAPSDKEGARHVSNIIRIEVFGTKD